ncbi:hypothetical protein MKY34_18020 [Sporosarcina sp. FSL K6-1522]|uniref:hypothetical protein n=1 Tax=Sporosarcina sp. FSL K6-1522 TaxID=2921554 RepID=UPI00315AFEA5
MKLQELVNAVNRCVDRLDLVTARRYIEGNMELLNDNKHRLKRNARELFDYLNTKTEDSLSRQEMNIVLSINSRAARFDIRGLKFLIGNHPDLLLRDDVKLHLTADAKAILEGMNMIKVS